MSRKKIFSNLVRGAAGLGLGIVMLMPATMASATPRSAGNSRSDAGSSATLFGSTVSSSADLAMKTRQFGHMPIVRVYYPGLPASNAWSTGLPARNGSAVVVSFKALPTSIIDGAHNGVDAVLEHFFDTAPTGHTIYYTYYHEPEDNISAGQFTLANYKTAWADVVRMADAAHNPYLRSTLTLMAYDFAPYSGRRWTNYLPAGHIISTLAWDAYPNNTGMGTPNPADSPSFMGDAVAASRAAGIPFGFAEFNTTTLSGRPSWYASVGNYCNSSGALFCTLYDDSYNGGLGGKGTFYVTDSASANAWRNVVGSAGSRGPRTTVSPPTLRLNETSLGVRMVQFGLKRLGFYPRQSAVGGRYGPVTNAAVRAFQKRYRCQPSGNLSQFGPGSWDALTSGRAAARSMPTLRPNHRSTAIAMVQYGLQRLGFYPGRGALNGNYGRVTNRAIRAFQLRHHTRPSYNLAQFGFFSWVALATA